MQPITILFTTLLPIISATPIFPVVRPFIPPGLARAVTLDSITISTLSDVPTETILAGPIPTAWRHTHTPPMFSHPFEIGPTYVSEEPVPDISRAKNVARAALGNSTATTANTTEIVPMTRELDVSPPPPPMSNGLGCITICSIQGLEPCGPCEDVPKEPNPLQPPPNAERTDLVTAGSGLSAEQKKAWVPLWQCLTQCLGEKGARCDRCNDYWTQYQKTFPPGQFKEEEMKGYVEMSKCLVDCERGRNAATCARCDALWRRWENKLTPFIVEMSSVATTGGVVKRDPFREDLVGLSIFTCLKLCDPVKFEKPKEICDRCEKFVRTFPPVLMHT